MNKFKFEVDTTELSRILTFHGNALIGCSSKVWESEKLFEKLQKLDDDKFIELLMIQKVGVRPPDEHGEDYTMCLFRALV